MTSLLLVIIYIAFISLGLPDSILGSAWPVMYESFSVPVSYAGLVSMIIAGGTIVSSLMSDKFMRKFGTGLVTLFSVALTAIALFGFSFSNSFVLICLWAVPYGLGAGSVDSALNNFVALHYKARHMSWLHCFWGVGAMTGPYIMGLCLSNNLRWNSGYRSIGYIQVVLVIFLFLALPLWKKISKKEETNDLKKRNVLNIKDVLRMKGTKNIFVAFFCYCALEASTGLWASSYLVLNKGISPETAAKFASLFYIGITAGRFLCGFVSEKFGDKKMVRIGQTIILLGIILMMIPSISNLSIIGLIVIGLGCAPIYPSLIHATPINFGTENSQSIMGMQMASAYVGTSLMPMLFGFISNLIGIKSYPFYLFFFVIIMFVMTEVVNKRK